MPHALLSYLDDAERADYLATLTAVTYPPGAVIFTEGGPGERFMFVTGGNASVTVGGEDVASVGAGSILGELALLRGTRRTATCVATEEVTGYQGTLEHLLDLFDRSPDAGRDLAELTARRIAPRVPAVRVTLPDGGALRLRPLLATDHDAFMHVYESWPPSKRYMRFFSAAPPDHVLRQLIDIDFVDHFAWIAFADNGDGIDEPTEAVGSARYIRVDDPASAQIAFGVAEDWQRRGVASVLIAALGAAAQVNGITEFTAEVLSENLASQALLRKFAMVFDFSEAGELHGTGPVADPSIALSDDEAEAMAQAAALITQVQ